MLLQKIQLGPLIHLIDNRNISKATLSLGMKQEQKDTCHRQATVLPLDTGSVNKSCYGSNLWLLFTSFLSSVFHLHSYPITLAHLHTYGSSTSAN